MFESQGRGIALFDNERSALAERKAIYELDTPIASISSHISHQYRPRELGTIQLEMMLECAIFVSHLSIFSNCYGPYFSQRTTRRHVKSRFYD
jgi:hypothetical protein